MSVEHGFNPSKETGMDPAEQLFEEIMADVRARKKTDSSASFKTHESYNRWLALRNKNIEETPITPAQQTAYSERQQAKFKTTSEDRRIESETVANEKAQADYYAQREAQEKEDRLDAGFDHYRTDSSKTINTITARQKNIDSDQEEARKKLREIKGEALNLVRVEGIIESLQDKLENYESKSAGFQELGQTLWGKAKNFLKRDSLNKEAEGLEAEIKELFGLLTKEFKSVAGDKSEEIAKLKNAFDDMSIHVSSGRLKLEALGYATTFLVLLGKLSLLIAATSSHGDVSHHQVGEKTGKPSVLAEASEDDNSTSGIVKSKSAMFQSGVAGYRVDATPVVTSEAEASSQIKETFALTEDEAAKVDSFKDWRRSILKPAYVGGEEKDGTVPTTDKGHHVDAGTKVEVTVGDTVMLSYEVKKHKGESSVWGILETNKDAIKKLADEKGWKNIGLWITGNEYKGDQSKNEGEVKTDKKTEAHTTIRSEAKEHKTGKMVLEKSAKHEVNINKVLAQNGVKIKHEFGKNYGATAGGYDRALKELEAAKVKIEHLSKKALDHKHTAKAAKLGEILGKLGLEIDRLKIIKMTEGKKIHLKHQPGHDYETEEEYEVAIAEMKNVQEQVEKTVHPFVAGEKISNQDLEDARVLKLIRSEIDRLNAKNNAKGIERHQRIIDKEDKVPEAAPPERMYATEAAKIRDLAREAEINLRAEQYSAGLVESHKALMATDILSATASEDEIKTALADVQESKKYYDHLLNERTIDDKFPAKKFVIQQAEFGKDIALGQIRSLQDRLLKPKPADVKAPEVVGAPHETTPVAEEDANIKKLTKLLPTGIQENIDNAYGASSDLFESDKKSPDRASFELSSDLLSMGTKLERFLKEKHTPEEIDQRIQEIEKISESLRLRIQTGELVPTEKQSSVLNQLDKALLDAKDFMLINKIY